ncbi:MAG TPA: AsmA-like C-terminal region-containing protein [Acetobacteraceae bacterium]|nr:AsmA-like C-terminal region-containing protein [Acetobacteraceae bacterium]
MRRLSGQAAIGAAMVLHWLATLAITLAVLGGVGVAAIAWRLSQGPVDLAWFTSRLEDAANANGGPTRLTIGSAALAWEGFSKGVDRPLDLRLTDIRVIDPAGGRRMNIPRAEVSLSIYELLFGRIVPRAVTLEGPQITLVRAADGTLSLDLGSLTEAADTGGGAPTEQATPVADLLAELARPAGSDLAHSTNALLGQLHLVRVHDARVVVVDRQLGVTWRAPHAEIDLARQPQGGVDGTAELSLAFGEQQARLTLVATLAAGASETHLRARLSPVTPSVIARAAPTLAALAALDAPVGGEATFDLDARLALREARVSLHAGAGQAHIGDSNVPLLDAALVASGTPDALTVQALRVSLPGRDTGPPTHLEMRGTLRRRTDQISADLTADLDQVDFADLARFWPEGIGGGARKWLVANIPAGIARNGHADLGVETAADLSSVELTRATGTLDGEGLQVHWLRPILPIDNGQAQLRIVDPDTLEITVAGGRERLRNQKDGGTAGLQIRGGRIRITGIMQPHQIAVIDADIAGPLADHLALLREPRLALLDRHPIELKNPAGQATVKVDLTVPLEDAVRMDDIAIQVQAHLDGVHLGGLVAGRDLDQGVFDLNANTDGMKLNGRALLASIPAKLDVAVDFRAGPPTQVTQSVTASAQPDARQLAAAGLDATSVLNGAAQVQAVLSERRNGQGDVAVTADLTGAELVVEPLEWRKPREASAKASARVLLDHDRLTGIDAVQLDGDGVVLRGRADFSGDRLSVFRLDRLQLDRTVAQGTLNLPATGPISVNLSGAALDLAPRLSRHTPPRPPTPNKAEPPPGPPWKLDAKFDRVLMAQGRMANDVVLHAESDGRVVRQLRLEGRSGARAPFLVQIVPDRGGRRLTASADDAGELLRGLDYIRSMQGGKLSVQAQYDDAQPDRPLAGTAEIEDFRIHDAPALGKLLQAMTLYGLVDVMRGSGLGFTRLVAPFRLTDNALDLADARAFSSSLGLTMKGRLDLDAQQIDMQGTIVPAYFFNSLLGNIPLVGKLFSPERGGGVFAASYTLRGRLDDPDVSVNPLAALTPGFLRGLFGLF